LTNTILETSRLRIRPFTLEDSPFILRLLNEPSFLKNIGDRGVRTLEDARAYLIEGPLKSYQVHGHGLYAVIHQESRVTIGMCGLLKRDVFDDVDLGYAFLPEFFSQGLASEAAQAVLHHAESVLGIRRCLALVSPHNEQSIRLLNRFGFQLCKTIPTSPGQPDDLLYEINF
jgi:[ribosomal protein S5]-alanine N-acetyltransferase